MDNCSRIIKDDFSPSTTLDYEKIRVLFDNVCSEIAARYNLYYLNGQPRRAKIIEIVSRTSCAFCIDRRLRENRLDRVDDLYKECHQLACNLLVEELYSQLCRIGYTVLITSEKSLEYGKVDVLIVPNRHGINLHYKKKEVAVEVKTGFSLSLTQLFRYILDNTDRSVVLWRIRSRQVLVFEGTELKPMLTQFMRMIVSRAGRLFADTQTSCEHTFEYKNWSPNQQQLQEAFLDFAHSVTETLPSVVEAVVKILDG